MRMLEIPLKLLRKIIKNHRKLLILQEGLTGFQGCSLGGQGRGWCRGGRSLHVGSTWDYNYGTTDN